MDTCDTKNIIILLLFLCCGRECTSARILGIFPIPSISHQVVYRALMEELSRRGHQVVSMTTDPVRRNISEYSNLYEIDVHNISYPHIRQMMPAIMDESETKSGIQLWTFVNDIFPTMIEEQLKVPEMQKILHDPDEKFDLCVFESLVPLVFGFADRFNCSVILISSLSGTISNFDAFGNPSNPVLYPEIFGQCAQDCSFVERLNEIIQYLQYKYFYYWKIIPKSDKIAKKYFGENMRSLREIESSADMMFLNCDPLFSGVRPAVPGIVYLGRLHLKPAEPLPQNIQRILDNSQHGVIYFSLGSNAKSNSLKRSLIEIFLETFRELPYTIIWKWENDTLPNKPPNVFTFKWLPQKDIFNHSNVKAFITQGGIQSMDEAISKQIPMIMMPVFGDQHINKKNAMRHGIGIGLDLHTVTKNILKSSLIEVIENPLYKKSIIKLSKLLVDQPMTPLERAVWWTEYVIRNNGAKHLRSPSADAPFYIYFLLDIIIFFLACAIITITVFYYLMKNMRQNWIEYNLKLKTS